MKKARQKIKLKQRRNTHRRRGGAAASSQDENFKSTE
jgi:hypothetical protein